MNRRNAVAPDRRASWPLVAGIAALLGMAAGVAGCLGGAQPVPPAVDPAIRADAGSGPIGDAGATAVDAGVPPPEVDLDDFAEDVRRAPPPFDPRPGWPIGWRPGDFGPPSTSSDAGVPSPAPASEGVDGPDGS